MLFAPEREFQSLVNTDDLEAIGWTDARGWDQRRITNRTPADLHHNHPFEEEVLGGSYQDMHPKCNSQNLKQTRASPLRSTPSPTAVSFSLIVVLILDTFPFDAPSSSIKDPLSFLGC